MEAHIEKRVKDWTSTPFDDDTIREVNKLLEEKNEKELEDRFYKILEFGTGGLRGVIGAGTNRMNVYTIGMATQGLANYILKAKTKNEGVVVARDSRRMSDEFARETATVLAGNGIKVFLFDDIMPTPLCSFAIRDLNAVSGIVITASHNPPEYNGYKVYWEDGGQVIPPHDKNIIEEVMKVDDINAIKKLDYDEGIKSGLIEIIGNEIQKSYFKKFEEYALRKKNPSKIKIVYTPLHGTGYKIVPDILNNFGFSKVTLVDTQSKPDENFPTVSSPNPEEKEALDLALKLAKEIDADIIMATDPDADRMGVGFKDASGEYILINGNQIGTMLEYYLLSRLKENGDLPKNGAIVKTIVTTELQREIAESFNCSIDDVLTGFKWIAAKMKLYDEKENKKFIFGGEESYGYLPVEFVRDKDAVTACYFFAEMADWLEQKDMTLIQFLDQIYIKYSLYKEALHSLTIKGMEGTEQIKNIMESLRKSPPSEFAGIATSRILDYQNLLEKDNDAGDTKKIEGLPSANVLQFFLSDGSKITMRPSGTEPKIKFYFSVKEKVTKENLELKKNEIDKKVESLKKDFLHKVDAIK